MNGGKYFVGTLNKDKNTEFGVRPLPVVPIPSAAPAPLYPHRRSATFRWSCAFPDAAPGPLRPQLDLPIDDTFTIRHTGESSVFVTGFAETIEKDEQEDGEEKKEEDAENDEDEDGDGEPEARPLGGPLAPVPQSA